MTAAQAAPHGGLRIPRLDGELVIEPGALGEVQTTSGTSYIARRPLCCDRFPTGRCEAGTVCKQAWIAGRHARSGPCNLWSGTGARGSGYRLAHAQHDSQHWHAWGSRGCRVQWIALLQASLAMGLTPPVLTDYLGLSVGGTLSVGGIGGASHRYGLQIDSIGSRSSRARGSSSRVHPRNAPACSTPCWAARAMCLIVRATITLVPARERARVYRLWYRDLTVYTSDQRLVVLDERFDYVEGQVVPAEGGGWMYMLEAVVYYTPPAVPDDTAVLDGLQGDPASMRIEEVSYFDWQNRLAPQVGFLQQTGAWFVPHPFSTSSCRVASPTATSRGCSPT